MAVPVISIHPKSVKIGNTTYDASSGGPIMVQFSLAAQPVESRTADDNYPRQVFIVDYSCVVTMIMRELLNLAIGQVVTLEIICSKASGTTKLTFVTMVYTGSGGNQARASESEQTHTFIYQSTDGSTNPLTISQIS